MKQRRPGISLNRQAPIIAATQSQQHAKTKMFKRKQHSNYGIRGFRNNKMTARRKFPRGLSQQTVTMTSRTCQVQDTQKPPQQKSHQCQSNTSKKPSCVEKSYIGGWTNCDFFVSSGPPPINTNICFDEEKEHSDGDDIVEILQIEDPEIIQEENKNGNIGIQSEKAFQGADRTKAPPLVFFLNIWRNLKSVFTVLLPVFILVLAFSCINMGQQRARINAQNYTRSTGQVTNKSEDVKGKAYLSATWSDADGALKQHNDNFLHNHYLSEARSAVTFLTTPSVKADSRMMIEQQSNHRQAAITVTVSITSNIMIPGAQRTPVEVNKTLGLEETVYTEACTITILLEIYAIVELVPSDYTFDQPASFQEPHYRQLLVDVNHVWIYDESNLAVGGIPLVTFHNVIFHPSAEGICLEPNAPRVWEICEAQHNMKQAKVIPTAENGRPKEAQWMSNASSGSTNEVVQENFEFLAANYSFERSKLWCISEALVTLHCCLRYILESVVVSEKRDLEPIYHGVSSNKSMCTWNGERWRHISWLINVGHSPLSLGTTNLVYTTGRKKGKVFTLELINVIRTVDIPDYKEAERGRDASHCVADDKITQTLLERLQNSNMARKLKLYLPGNIRTRLKRSAPVSCDEFLHRSYCVQRCKSFKKIKISLPSWLWEQHCFRTDHTKGIISIASNNSIDKTWKDEFHIVSVLDVRGTVFWQENHCSCERVNVCVQNKSFGISHYSPDDSIAWKHDRGDLKIKARVCRGTNKNVSQVLAGVLVTFLSILAAFSQGSSLKFCGTKTYSFHGLFLLLLLINLSCAVQDINLREYACSREDPPTPEGEEYGATASTPVLPRNFNANDALDNPRPGDAELLQRLGIDSREIRPTASYDQSLINLNPMDIPPDDLLTGEEYPVSSLSAETDIDYGQQDDSGQQQFRFGQIPLQTQQHGVSGNNVDPTDFSNSLLNTESVGFASSEVPGPSSENLQEVPHHTEVLNLLK